MAELAGWVEAGPDLAPIWLRPGSGRRGALAAQGPLPRRIEAAVGVALHERTVGKQLAASNWRQATGGKQLAALGFRRLSVLPKSGAPAAPEVRCHSAGRF